MSDTNGTNATRAATSAEKHDEVSKVEIAKQRGRHLRGTIDETLRDIEAAHFTEDDRQLLKFHGIYEQDDRDTRAERRKAGLDKLYSFMIRVAVPGGRATAQQYLDIDALAQRYGGGSIRLTTRQAYQLHGITKEDLPTTMRGINEALLTSLAACGDIPRNMMASPAPYADDVHRGVQRMARDLAHALAPGSGAYHQIWVEGEKVVDSDELQREEPFYGDAYLPRKFKIGVAIDDDNSIDVYAYDCGLIAITEGGGSERRIVGYNLTVGGGFGMTHNKPDTVARIASPIAHVAPENALESVRQVVALFRDEGERSDRRHARIKYLLERWGVERFTDELRKRCAFELGPPAPLAEPKQLDHLGRFDQGDGRQFLGVWVENGRITDRPNHDDGTPGPRYASAFREIAKKLAPAMINTPMQSMILGDLEPAQVDEAIEILERHNVPLVETMSNARRYAMACPALPTCGLALTESERVSPEVVGGLESLLAELDLADVELTIRMTGCPNGCARPYNADIGIVGRKPGVYHLFVGGGLRGDRIADLFAADVKIDDIPSTLRPLLERFRVERRAGEGLSDWYRREIAAEPERRIVTGRETPATELYQVGLPA